MDFVDNMTWRRSGSLAIGQTSSPLPLTEEIRQVTVGLYPTGGTAKVQITISTPEEVAASTAVWFDWGLGEVSDNTMDVLEAPVSAIRVVALTGSAKFDLGGW